MQKLQFEAAWEKTIAQQDRELIEQAFRNGEYKEGAGITCQLIRTAVNYKNQVLITAIIHNRSSELLVFENRAVHFTADQGTATEYFTFPALKIPANISMPWTFIVEAGYDFLEKGTKGCQIIIK